MYSPVHKCSCLACLTIDYAPDLFDRSAQLAKIFWIFQKISLVVRSPWVREMNSSCFDTSNWQLKILMLYANTYYVVCLQFFEKFLICTNINFVCNKNHRNIFAKVFDFFGPFELHVCHTIRAVKRFELWFFSVIIIKKIDKYVCI